MDQQAMSMPQEQAPAQAQGAPLPPPNPDILSPLVQSHMDELEQMRKLMDGKMGQAYDRVLMAGMKMLYSPDNAQMVQQLIEDPAVPMANKLGEGIANLVVMMDNEGNGTIPKEVIVPVGVALMFEAADYLFEVGIEVTEDDLSNGLELLLMGVMTGYGLDPAKIDAIVDDMGKKLGFEEKDEAAEAAPAQPAVDEEDAAFNEGFAQEQVARQGQ